MPAATRDPRLDELTFLAALARLEPPGWLILRFAEDSPERRMVAFAIEEGLVWGPGANTCPPSMDAAAFERTLHQARIGVLRDLLSGQDTRVSITHRGRTRIAELGVALLSGRHRDPSGIVWERPLLYTDVEISLRTGALPAVAMLDLNGLRAINEGKGSHEAGDRAIRIFHQVLASTIGADAEAYRGSGGGQAYVVLRATSIDDATRRMTDLLKELAAQKTPYLGTLTAACGIAAAKSPDEDPAALVQRAEQAQTKAKELARRAKPRPSVVAADGMAPRVLPAE